MNKLQTIIATGLVTVPLVLGMSDYKKAKNSTNTNQAIAEQVQDDTHIAAHYTPSRDDDTKLRNTVLSYLTSPEFSNSDFLEQITGTKAELQELERGGMIYFSIPKQYYSKEMMKKLAVNPDLVEFGKTTDGKFSGVEIELGDYVLRELGNYFFRFPSNNFRVDKTDTINIPYKSANYLINMQELQSFIMNKSIFGGYLNVDTGRTDRFWRPQVFANHGAFVAKKGESSLEKLVNSLTKNKSTDEGKAQSLLDFVTNEIKYSHSEANSNIEVLKRPNEVLMTGGSDCSGKVILYASLLEQTNTDYRLAYIPSENSDSHNGHITVVVGGDYGNINGLSLNIGGTTYSVAETTVRHFQIGHSRLNGNFGIEDIKYIQRPGKDSKIYDTKTGEPLSFQ